MHEIVFYYPQGHEAHFEFRHPESPERVEVIRQALVEAGYWDAFPHLDPIPLSREFLATVHTPAYLEILKTACAYGAHLDSDTYTTPASWQLALNAAGGAVAITRSIWRGESRTGFALTRPPGHHAMASRGMGFCLLNNVAIAAEDLLHGSLEGAPNAQRLAIVDLDLHHGNGTQDIFWQRSDVFYTSTHQYPFYPGTGNLLELGEGPGEGFTANFPFQPTTGDQGFRAVMHELILPLLSRFSPEMVLVSIGFDAHWRDPLGSLLLTTNGYGELVADLVDWTCDHCDGKLALFLEGGYDAEADAACAKAVTAALLQRPWEDPIGASPYNETFAWQVMVRQAHQLWKV